jgi:hypothetical protein
MMKIAERFSDHKDRREHSDRGPQRVATGREREGFGVGLVAVVGVSACEVFRAASRDIVDLTPI